MTHYRQIILDLAVEDDTSDEKLKELAEKIKEYMENEVDCAIVKEVGIRVN